MKPEDRCGTEFVAKWGHWFTVTIQSIWKDQKMDDLVVRVDIASGGRTRLSSKALQNTFSCARSLETVLHRLKFALLVRLEPCSLQCNDITH